MAILTVGVDLAKNVFALHGVNKTGVVQLRQPKVARTRLNALMASLPPFTIGMEACSGAHHWARLFAAHGHTACLSQYARLNSTHRGARQQRVGPARGVPDHVEEALPATASANE